MWPINCRLSDNLTEFSSSAVYEYTLHIRMLQNLREPTQCLRKMTTTLLHRTLYATSTDMATRIKRRITPTCE
jgi:hypothetical protein